MNRDFYQQKYEHEDITIQRKYLLLWFEVTASQKDARADKEMEMMILTRRNNHKMKIEVRGVMNAVIFGLWKNWAKNKIERREEWARQLEREKKEADEAKKREELRERTKRKTDVKQRMSWMTGARRSSFSIAKEKERQGENKWEESDKGPSHSSSLCYFAFLTFIQTLLLSNPSFGHRFASLSYLRTQDAETRNSQ